MISVAALLLLSCEKSDEDRSDSKRTVILDSDMVESFGDGVAFMMLLGAENVDVKGLTTETDNVWAQEALAYGVRIGELCGGLDVDDVRGSPGSVEI